MTIKNLYDRVLTLIDEPDGATEYQDRFLAAINITIKEIAMYARPIMIWTDIATADRVLTLPNDVLKLIAVKVGTEPSPYAKIGVGKLQMPADGTYTVQYSKVPPEVTASDIAGSTAVATDPATYEALQYGCAALTVFDEVELYDLYTARYQNALVNLSQAKEATITATITGGVDW
ncbi:MAG: hypothetical protein ACOYI4_03760 [Christensenellales bacterium]|jgi:hypothetical protein